MTVGWLPLAIGITGNIIVTYAIAWAYSRQIVGLGVRITMLEEMVERGIKISAQHADRSEFRMEMQQVCELIGDAQAEIDTLKESVGSQIVSRVTASQENTFNRLIDALKPIDIWRAKNDLEFKRLLENWDELRRYTEDEVLGIKGQNAMCFERIDACKAAAVEAKRMSHETQIMLEGVADSLSERISAFQKEAIIEKPKPKKKPAKTKAKKHG